jgi:thymidylate synthase (FAD)
MHPSASLEWATPDALSVIERAGRTCYKSEDKITPESSAAFVRMLIKAGHEAMVEHAVASFRFVCDRGVTHELVRHRLASFAQESTRYCNYSGAKFGGIAVIEPPGLDAFGLHDWRLACEQCERSYINMTTTLGIKPQIARSVLPTCLKTEIVCTMNFREWRHTLKLRTSKSAHPQIAEIMGDVMKWFKSEYPVIVEDLA